MKKFTSHEKILVWCASSLACILLIVLIGIGNFVGLSLIIFSFSRSIKSKRKKYLIIIFAVIVMLIAGKERSNELNESKQTTNVSPTPVVEITISSTTSPIPVATPDPTPTLKPSSTPKPSSTVTPATWDIIKKSSAGLCHAPGTTYYNKTKIYTSYNSLKACLDSGGILPQK